MGEETDIRAEIDKLVAELYGEGNPVSVSDEDVQRLVRSTQNRRESMILFLVRVSEISGFTPAKLIEMLNLDISSPEQTTWYIQQILHICNLLDQKGYGSEIQRVITTDGVIVDRNGEALPAPASLATESEQVRVILMVDAVLYMRDKN